jgi:FkbM family methyltransferase
MIENLIELRDSWWWPKHDVACWKYLSRRQHVPNNIASYVTEKRVVVQAGGNAGMYVQKYQNIFETVYTFEPDPINFYCLTKNTGQNVIKFQSCLGDNTNFVNLSYDEINSKKPNTGGYRVKGEGNIPTVILDNLNIPIVNLIHLDIEGFEKFALLGAVDTIKRCKPIIALELNGLAEKYNHTNNDVKDLVIGLGYKEIGIVDDDAIFKFIK